MNRGESFQRELLRIAVELDARLYGKTPPKESAFSLPVEILCTVLGSGLGLNVRAVPSALANLVSRAIATSLASSAPSGPVPAGPKAAGAGLLIVTSHPETTPKESHLMGELILQALRVSESLSPGSKLTLVQAVDDFALDTLSPAVKGLYQGLMNQANISMDRSPGEKYPLVRALLPGSHYSLAVYKILKSLKRGETVCLALPGGVIHNSRVLYGIRESARRLYKEIPPVRRARERRREFELSVIRLLTQGRDCAASRGTLSREEETGLKTGLQARGIAGEKIQVWMESLKEELALLSPYRERFFRVLLSRLGSKGLTVVPITHKDGNGRTGIFTGEPWRTDGTGAGWEKDLKQFVRRSFPAG